MFNIEQFTKDNVTYRQESLFHRDIEQNKEELQNEISGKSVLVIGGAGSIGSSFIKAILKFHPSKLVVVDLNENGLAELTRDLRSTNELQVPDKYITYTIDFADPIFEKIFKEHEGFDIVANFSAHKHVRSEKDRYSVEALIRNNVFKARNLLELLKQYPPKHFFCVSTDKAANPVNIMGASKKIMEELILSYTHNFKVTTARFANVAFSNGSLPLSFFDRVMKNQPLVAPSDVKRYFVSLDESGEICMLACILGKSGEIFFPKLPEEGMKTFSSICDDFVKELGYRTHECKSEEEAKHFAATMGKGCDEYPVLYQKSDTTGEKAYEEFYVSGEDVDMKRFDSLGVIKEKKSVSSNEVNQFIDKLDTIFNDSNFTKAQVVDCIKEFIPNFEHEEKGKNLDQKM